MDDRERAKLREIRYLLDSGVLQPRELMYVNMHFFDHIKQSEIAAICGVTDGSVSRGLHRAYKRLRPLITEFERGYDAALKRGDS